MPGSAIGENGDDAEILASACWSAASESGQNAMIHASNAAAWPQNWTEVDS